MSSNWRLPFGVVDLDGVAFFLVENGAADRRGGGNHPLLRVRVFRHDELVDDRLAALRAEMHRRSEPRLVVRNAIHVHERDLAHPLLQHRDARVDDPLPFLGGLVLGVLAQIAVLARALDLPRQVDLQLALERGDFVVESLENPILHGEIDFSTVCYARIAVTGHGDRSHDSVPPWPVSRENDLQPPERDRARVSRPRRPT